MSTLPPRPTPQKVEEAFAIHAGHRFVPTRHHRVAVAELLHLRAEVAALRELFKDLYNTACFDYETMPEAGLRAFQSVVIEWCGRALDTQPQPQPEPPQPRTVREWLETIPCPKWRAAALERCMDGESLECSLCDSLMLIYWSKNNEVEQWAGFYNAIFNGTELPPCPFGKEGA